MTVSNEMSTCKKGLNSINFQVNNRHSGLKSCIYYKYGFGRNKKTKAKVENKQSLKNIK